ncbi:transporter [Halorarum salinum]|uniref:Transporter n=1 Tax=Halorarum salinum TaxID=2743089 RepID=A0A7D5QHU9_9EURY|nr:transporter [Halobaculum salinum]QLG63022.1 transporter [Halobaculum salinum]
MAAKGGVSGRVPTVTGVIAGVGAYVVSYLVTYVRQFGTVEDRLRGINVLVELFGNDPIPAWKAVGWYFYNAHFVNVLIPNFGGTRTENLIASGGDGSLSLLYAVPPLVLLLAGVAVAAYSNADDPAGGAVMGLTLVPVYALLALVGTFVFAYGSGDGGSVRPDYVTGVLLAGVVYPLVFATTGGVLGSLPD